MAIFDRFKEYNKIKIREDMKNAKVVHVAIVEYTLPGDYHGPTTLLLNTEKLHENKKELIDDVCQLLAECHKMKGQLKVIHDYEWLNEKSLCGKFTVEDVPVLTETDKEGFNPYQTYQMEHSHQSYHIQVKAALYVEQIDMLFDLKELDIYED